MKHDSPKDLFYGGLGHILGKLILLNMHMLQSEILKNYLKFCIQGKSGSHVLILKWFVCKFSGCNDRPSYTSSLKHPSLRIPKDSFKQMGMFLEQLILLMT